MSAMRFLRPNSREHYVTRMLRLMRDKQFPKAVAALRRATTTGPIPPPHALWKLGRWCLEHNRAKDAIVVLQLFADLYENHEDRAQVLHDLALAYKGAKRIKRAAQVAREALRLGGQLTVGTAPQAETASAG